jgi:hypothetical protein
MTVKAQSCIDATISVLTGADAYLHMLGDVYAATRNVSVAEVLCSDDRAARPGEQEAERGIRATGPAISLIVAACNHWRRAHAR